MKHSKHYSTCVDQSSVQMLNGAPPLKKFDRMWRVLDILFIGLTWQVVDGYNYVNYCQLIILFRMRIKLNSSHVFVVVPHLKWAFGNVFTSTWGSDTYLVVFNFNYLKIFWRSNIHWQQLLWNELYYAPCSWPPSIGTLTTFHTRCCRRTFAVLIQLAVLLLIEAVMCALDWTECCIRKRKVRINVTRCSNIRSKYIWQG